jgi:predicted nucleic acid-binding protein
MNVFLDTNILLDLLDGSRSDHAAATEILRQAYDGRIQGWVTSVSIVNTTYVMRKVMEPDAIGRYMLRILNTVELSPLGSPEMKAAMASGWRDLEDAVQFHSALAVGKIEAIVTNDPDFKQQKLIPVLSPRQFLRKLDRS